MKTNSLVKWPFRILCLRLDQLGYARLRAASPLIGHLYRPLVRRLHPLKFRLPAPPSPVQEPPRTPLPQEAKIGEQDLKAEELRSHPLASKETTKPPVVTPEVTTAPLADDSSLLAKITPGTSPQRAGVASDHGGGEVASRSGYAPKSSVPLGKDYRY